LGCSADNVTSWDTDVLTHEALLCFVTAVVAQSHCCDDENMKLYFLCCSCQEQMQASLM